MVNSMHHNLMFPSNWHDEGLQFRLIKAGITAPINTSGLQNLYPGLPDKQHVYVPFIADDSIKILWGMTGGNPISDIDRNKLCLVVTPTIRGFKYDEVFYGVPMPYSEEMTQKQLPSYFETNVMQVRDIAIRTLNDLTDQKYEVIATKLNPLSSGKGNLVIFVKFESECPFDKQFYTQSTHPHASYQKVRFIPKPIVTKFGAPQPGIKISFKFLNVSQEMFSELYVLFQNFIESDLKMHLRFMKIDEMNRCIHIFGQYVDHTDINVIKKTTEVFFQKHKKNLIPYIMTGYIVTDTEL